MPPPREKALIPLLRLRVLASIAIVIAIFAAVGMLSSEMLGSPALQAGLTAAILGGGVGLFEELYVQRDRGRGLRRMHPLGSILIYTGIVCILLLLAALLSHLVLGAMREMPDALRRPPGAIPAAIGGALAGVIGFLGADTLFYLLTGKYCRPAFEQKILHFLDMKDSTATAERLGALKAMEPIREFLFDLSEFITENGGSVAAGMEQVAKEHAAADPRFRTLPTASVKSVKEPVEIYEYLR